MLVAAKDGAVDLYHDNAKKLETTATGITVTGAITVGQINAASGSKIYTVGSGTYELDIAGALTLSSGRDNGASMLFEVSNSEKMRIVADGKVGIGLTSPTTTLHVKSPTGTGADVYAGTIENAKTDNSTATTGLRVKYTSVTPGDGNHMFQCLDSGGTVRFFVQNNGTRGGTSDRTLKENIVDATAKLAELRQLKVRNYNWIDHGPEGGFKELGFIAQEVETIFPKMVRANPETGKKMLLDDVFVPILVKSLQEAADKIDALETRITALEAG